MRSVAFEQDPPAWKIPKNRHHRSSVNVLAKTEDAPRERRHPLIAGDHSTGEAVHINTLLQLKVLPKDGDKVVPGVTRRVSHETGWLTLGALGVLKAHQPWGPWGFSKRISQIRLWRSVLSVNFLPSR